MDKLGSAREELRWKLGQFLHWHHFLIAVVNVSQQHLVTADDLLNDSAVPRVILAEAPCTDDTLLNTALLHRLAMFNQHISHFVHDVFQLACHMKWLAEKGTC